MEVQGTVTASTMNLAAGAGSSATVAVGGSMVESDHSPAGRASPDYIVNPAYLGVSDHLVLGGTWDPSTSTGTQGGSATMTVSNGAQVSVAGATVLYAGSSVTLDGGTLSTGSIVEMGGTISFASDPNTGLTVQGDLAIGTSHALDDAVDLVDGSTLNVFGNATFDPGADVTLDGGTANFAALISNGGQLHLNTGTLGVDNLNLENGSAVGPTLNVGPGLTVTVAQATTLAAEGSLSVTGGSFSTNTLVNNSPNPVTFSSGSLTINNGLTIDTFGPDRPLGNSLGVHGDNLAVGLLLVGQTDSGTLVVDSGGTVNAGDTGIGAYTGSTGSVQVGGTASVESDASWTSAETYLGYEPLDNDGPLVDGGTGSMYIGTGASVTTFDVFIRRGSSMTIEGGTVSTSTINLASDSDPPVGSANFTMTGGSFGTLAISVAPGCNCSITGSATSFINFFDNLGTSVLGGTQNWIGPATCLNEAGVTTFQTDASSGGGPSLVLIATGGSVILQTSQHLAELAVSGSGHVSMSATSPHNVLVTGSLSFDGASGAWQGLLDLANNDMIVHNGVLADISSQITQGYNGGQWNGSAGIISTSAAATQNTALAVELNDDGTGNPLITQFDGESVGPTDVLIKYTYFGDANLDGVVNGSDYTLIDNGFNNQLTGWRNGDFNYDGVVNGDDYTLIDNAFNTQGAPLMAQAQKMIAGDTALITAANSSVPEPASLAAAMGIGLLLTRRTRRNQRAQ